MQGARLDGPAGAGPFARLRQGTVLSPNSYIGNFVETKNATIASNSLACHLAYIGGLLDRQSRHRQGTQALTHPACM